MIVSGRLDLPWDAPLFTEGPGQVLICTASDERAAGDGDAGRASSATRAASTSRRCSRHLRTERGVRALLCEGGPRLHGELIEAGLVDELFVTRAPKLSRRRRPGPDRRPGRAASASWSSPGCSRRSRPASSSAAI